MEGFYNEIALRSFCKIHQKTPVPESLSNKVADLNLPEKLSYRTTVNGCS